MEFDRQIKQCEAWHIVFTEQKYKKTKKLSVDATVRL